MIASHIHHALSQVQELQRKVLEGQRFKGYSGRARAISGTIALLTAVVLATPAVPATPRAHLFGWGAAFVLSCLVNYGALLYWFLFDPVAKRDIRRLGPTTDALPPFFVGGVLTLLLIHIEQYQYLFGIWMALYGLANLASRRSLPKGIRTLGWFYILCGTVCLFLQGFTFLNPWPMGLVFFTGEWIGGVIFHYNGLPSISMLRLFNRKREDEHVRSTR